MKTVSISGYKRIANGKSTNNQLRVQGFVPCNLYGNGRNVTFTVFQEDFKESIYTHETYQVVIDVEGEKYTTVIQEVQFNPLSDEISHVDFLEINADKIIKTKLPIKYVGNSVGVRAGGKLVKKLKALKVKGNPNELPSEIEVDISHLDLGKLLKVSDIAEHKGVTILNNRAIPIASIEIPRGLKSATEVEAPGKKKKK